ncbi:MAG: MBOAT family protein [Planctomycetota bacterium]
MLFSSALFVFAFLPLVLGLYFVLHPRLRNAWLLLTSLVFYAWGEPVVALVMLGSIAMNYGLGLWVEQARARGRGRGVVALAVVLNVGLLVFFKYTDWLVASLTGWPPLGSALEQSSPWRVLFFLDNGSIRLPIGISFFTFQAFSYVIDVYRREAPVQKNPFQLGLYVAFFPQLIAGPIVRYRDIAAALVERTVTRAGFAYGIRRFVLGLGKKMLIANVCAEAADGVFGTATQAGVPLAELAPELAWLALVAYTLQIYFDFSGYSDMAIGLGHMFGFRFLENFEHPYVSGSISEFWRRWHISLSSWFRDYLYVPLGGNRRGPARTYANLVVVFVLCGLWHGANATFLVWGLFHGAFLVLERLGLGAALARGPRVLRHVYVLGVVMIGWVFFRADSLGQALGFLGAILGRAPVPVDVSGVLVPARAVHLFSAHADLLTWIALAAGILGAMPWLPRLAAWLDARAARGHTRARALCEVAGLGALVLVFVHVAMALAAGGYNPFIYFRF